MALRAARAVTKIPSEVDDATIEPSHMEWLREFTKDYQAIEPELVQALHETAIRRAFGGPYFDLVQICSRNFRGARHDRKNTLLSYFLELDRQSSKAGRLLVEYLAVDLPTNEELPASLRAALASQIHYMLALAQKEAAEVPLLAGLQRFWEARRDLVIGSLENALNAYPANADAYDEYESLVAQELEGASLAVAERQRVEAKLAELRVRRLQVFPNPIETRLKLVDYLLDSERSSEAKEHVQWLEGTRTDNPLADSMPWKWNLLEAMRYSRRKAGYAMAIDHLMAAKEHWPRWLSMQWWPYLLAAIHFRNGQTDAFDAIAPEQRVPSALCDACMRLGAAQKMSVAAADIKPLRKVVDDYVKQAAEVESSELVSAACFFWDLCRTGLKYSGYRLHAPKFLLQLQKLIEQRADPRKGWLDEAAARACLLVIGHEGLLLGYSRENFPVALRSFEGNGLLDAAFLAGVTGNRRAYRLFSHQESARRVGQAAASQTDVFYRYYYQDLVERFQQKLQRKSRSISFSRRSSQIAGAFGGAMDEDEDYYEESRYAECDCSDCRRLRGEI